MPTSHSNFERCEVQRSEDNGRLHVLRWSKCVTRTASSHFKGIVCVCVCVCVCMYVDSHCETNIGTFFCVSEGIWNFSRYFKISNFFIYVTIFCRTPAIFFGTLFGNVGLETRAVLFKTVSLYCKFKGNMIRVLMYRYFLQTWFRPAVYFNDIERSCGEN